jgi:hypothetical protein
MPAVSKKQFRFMQAAAHGGLSQKDGPSKAQAKEYVSHNKGSKSYSNLPEEHHEKKAAYTLGVEVALRSVGLK